METECHKAFDITTLSRLTSLIFAAVRLNYLFGNDLI